LGTSESSYVLGSFEVAYVKATTALLGVDDATVVFGVNLLGHFRNNFIK
jgi:hypothetical protein